MIAYETCVIALPCADIQALGAAERPSVGPCGAEFATLLACEPEQQPAPKIYFEF